MFNFSFSIGSIAFIGAGAAVLLYLVSFGLRYIGAWFVRGEPPKDRVMALVVVCAVFGFALGGFVQPQWNTIGACQGAGHTFMACLLSMEH